MKIGVILRLLERLAGICGESPHQCTDLPENVSLYKMNLPDNPGQWSRKVGILVYESERGEYFHKLWLQLKEAIGWNRPFFYIVSSSMTSKCKIGQTNAVWVATGALGIQRPPPRE